MKALDWIFKIGLLIIGAAFVFVYFLSSQNDRHAYREDSTDKNSRYAYHLNDRNVSVFDTKTGIFHIYYGPQDGVGHVDLLNGKISIEPINRTGVKAK